MEVQQSGGACLSESWGTDGQQQQCEKQAAKSQHE